MRRVVNRTSLQPWVLDEIRHAGRENLDPRHVALYDDKEDADAAAEVERLVDLGLDAGGRRRGQRTGIAVGHRPAVPSVTFLFAAVSLW